MLAEAVGAKPPRRVPAWLGRLAAGEAAVSMFTEIRGPTTTRPNASSGGHRGGAVGAMASRPSWQPPDVRNWHTGATIGPMLYGRDAEVSRITEVLEGARESRSAVLVIRGEAGVGKSALLENAREQASDMRVLRARGIESEAQLPYAGLHQLLRPVLGDIDDLPVPQARALRGALGLEEGASDEWFLVSLAVLTLLADASERRPLLCLVDDAHWLDAGSAASLVFAGRRLGPERVVLLFAARDGDVRTFETPEFEELSITGLDAGAAGALLEQRASVALSPEARDQLIAGTGGNPLALLELSATLTEEQLAGAVEPLPVERRGWRTRSCSACGRSPSRPRRCCSSPPPTRSAERRRCCARRRSSGPGSRRSTPPRRPACCASTARGSNSATR